MAGKCLFNVLSRSCGSGVSFSSPFAPNLGNSSRFYISPFAEYSGLSDEAANAYRAADAAVAGMALSQLSNIDSEVHALASGVLKKVRAFVSYVDNEIEFKDLPKSVMSQFGFNPLSSQECPILQTPNVKAVDNLATTFVPGGPGGPIYAGRVDLNKLPGGKHFYMVAAKCGNINTIAKAANLPADRVAARLGSMLGMLATWSGCMMAGGANIVPTSDALSELDKMDHGGPAPKNSIFGRGVLTYGKDMVQLQNATREVSGVAQVHSFLARTLYYHALVGTVLHMQYVAPSGDISWFWVGGGGKGFISEYVSNIVAIRLDVGMWPDMARAMRKFYADPNMIRKFVGAKPQAIKKLIQELVKSSEEKRGLFLSLEQYEQTNNSPANDLREHFQEGHSVNAVKGED